MNDKLLRKALQLYKNDIFAFVRKEFGAEPTKQQAQLLRAVLNGKSVSVRSGHGTGKSASLSWVLLWFLLTKPYSKVIATAPTRRQLRDVLWAEAKMWLNRSVLAKQLIVPQAETFRVVGSDSWFARAVSINTKDSPDQQAETLAGYHAPYLLVLVDEASGVPDPVYRPLEGMLTTKGTQIVLAGNPTRTGYYFHRTHADPFFQKFYVRLHWSAEESENVSREWIEDMLQKYSRDSATYKIRVLGEFVDENEMKLITDEELYRSVWRRPAQHVLSIPAVIGIDTAKLNDWVAIAYRHGQVITAVERVLPSKDTSVLCKRVLEKLTVPVYSIAVDITGGYGDGLYECLRERFRRRVIGVNFSWKARDGRRYVLYRDEMYGRLFEALAQQKLQIPDNPQLLRQLQTIARQFVYDEKLRIKLKPKTDIKVKLGESPDDADAVALTMIEPLHYEEALKWSSERRKGRPKRAVSWILR